MATEKEIKAVRDAINESQLLRFDSLDTAKNVIAAYEKVRKIDIAELGREVGKAVGEGVEQFRVALEEARTQPECDYCAAFQARDWQTVEAVGKCRCEEARTQPESAYPNGYWPQQPERPFPPEPETGQPIPDEPKLHDPVAHIPDEAVEAAARAYAEGVEPGTWDVRDYDEARRALTAALPHLEAAWVQGNGHWSWCVPVHPEDLPADYKGYPDGGRLILATDEAAIRADERAKFARRFSESFFKATVLMNDTFDYATADGEELWCDHYLDEAFALFAEFGHIGLVALVAIIRDRDPLPAYLKETGQQQAFIEAKHAALTTIEGEQ